MRMAASEFTPFCVADRPMSLRILRGIDLAEYSGRVGIMVHANTSKQFQRLLKEYPLEHGICPSHKVNHRRAPCEYVREVRRRTTKVGDSGVFTKNGATLAYPELFAAYRRSGVRYGIIIDHLMDTRRTLASARNAMEQYRRRPRSFQLVAVAQGRNVREYLRCYAALKKMGYRHVAIGGLLRRRKNTARYVYVRGGRLFRILDALRSKYPRDWMFALGCYHPRRHDDLSHYGLFGSDYKGWIFNYEPAEGAGVGPARRSRFSQVRNFLRDHVYNDSRTPLPWRNTVKNDQQLAIVACSKRKIWDRQRRGGTVAENAYEGTFFRLARDFVQNHADRWVILSARHGLINPRSLVASNYDSSMRPELRYPEILRLRRQVTGKGLFSYSRVVVFGGQRYFDAARLAFAPFTRVENAFGRGVRIGERLRRLKAARSFGDLLADSIRR